MWQAVRTPGHASVDRTSPHHKNNQVNLIDYAQWPHQIFHATLPQTAFIAQKYCKNPYLIAFSA